MFVPAADRYQKMSYARSGRSGLKLPRIPPELWHNFGGTCSHGTARERVLKSFDRGITHFEPGEL